MKAKKIMRTILGTFTGAAAVAVGVLGLAGIAHADQGETYVGTDADGQLVRLTLDGADATYEVHGCNGIDEDASALGAVSNDREALSWTLGGGDRIREGEDSGGNRYIVLGAEQLYPLGSGPARDALDEHTDGCEA